MQAGDDPREAALEEAASRLTEGLKTCRAVMQNYRDLLSDERSNCKAIVAPEERSDQPSLGDGPKVDA
jgi:hypothetical protein